MRNSHKKLKFNLMAVDMRVHVHGSMVYTKPLFFLTKTEYINELCYTRVCGEYVTTMVYFCNLEKLCCAAGRECRWLGVEIAA